MTCHFFMRNENFKENYTNSVLMLIIPERLFKFFNDIKSFLWLLYGIVIHELHLTTCSSTTGFEFEHLQLQKEQIEVAC